MKILIAHNHYGNFAPGGEAQVVYREAQLLKERGHTVQIYERTNAELLELGLFTAIKALWQCTWSEKSRKEIGCVLDTFKPDILHVHNYKWILTPSIFSAARERGVASVLTLHNYRLACPAGQFLCRGHVCEDCLTKPSWFCIPRRCTNRVTSTLAQWHLYRGTQQLLGKNMLADLYIVLSAFARDKFKQAGLPTDRIYIKPNTMPDPIKECLDASPGNGALFVGRLSHEKGLLTLLEAWKGITECQLTIVGDGPLRSKVEKMVDQRIQLLGHRNHDEVMSLMHRSLFVVTPSECYEGFPGVILEAMAMGRAVIASDLGARREMIEDGQSGLLFRAGDASDLQRVVRKALQNIYDLKLMGLRARENFLRRYLPEDNMRKLETIYKSAITQLTYH